MDPFTFVATHPETVLIPGAVIAFVKLIGKSERKAHRNNTLTALWLDGWLLTHKRHGGNLDLLPYAAIRAEREEQARTVWLEDVHRFNRPSMSARTATAIAARAHGSDRPEQQAITASVPAASTHRPVLDRLVSDRPVELILVDGRLIEKWWAV
jgi:hypothetical protein